MAKRKRNQHRRHERRNGGNALPPNFNINDYYCLKETAAKFAVTERTILNWRKAKKLTGYNHERYVLFKKTIIDMAAEQYKRLGFLPEGL